jgi:hypothetical protein
MSFPTCRCGSGCSAFPGLCGCSGANRCGDPDSAFWQCAEPERRLVKDGLLIQDQEQPWLDLPDTGTPEALNAASTRYQAVIVALQTATDLFPLNGQLFVAS